MLLRLSDWLKHDLVTSQKEALLNRIKGGAEQPELQIDLVEVPAGSAAFTLLLGSAVQTLFGL